MMLEQREREETGEQSGKVAETASVMASAKSAVRKRARPLMRASLIVLALLVLINVALQINRRPFDIQSDGFWAYKRLATCESLGRAPDVLFLGSSRTLYSADAHQADDVMAQQFDHPTLSCNLGRMGASIENDYYIFKRMVEDGYAPKLLIENLWENNLNVNADIPMDIQGTNISQIVRLADISDAPALNAHLGHYSAPSMADFLAQKAIPLYGDRVGIYHVICGSSHLGPCGVNTDEWDPETIKMYNQSDDRGWTAVSGYSLANVPPDKLQNDYMQLYGAIYKGIQHFQIGGHQTDYLAKMVALAKAHGVKVALVVSPVAPIYLKFFDAPDEWSVIMNYWQSFAKQHGVAFYDESLAPGYVPADFQDPHHLTASGAVKFSTWMAQAIIAPALT